MIPEDPDPLNTQAPAQIPILWWQSPTLRSVAVAMAPAIVVGLRAVHIDLTESVAADVVIALCAGFAGVVIIRRRVKAGKDPANPQPPIKMSVI